MFKDDQSGLSPNLPLYQAFYMVCKVDATPHIALVGLIFYKRTFQRVTMIFQSDSA